MPKSSWTRPPFVFHLNPQLHPCRPCHLRSRTPGLTQSCRQHSQTHRHPPPSARPSPTCSRPPIPTDSDNNNNNNIAPQPPPPPAKARTSGKASSRLAPRAQTGGLGDVLEDLGRTWRGSGECGGCRGRRKRKEEDTICAVTETGVGMGSVRGEWMRLCGWRCVGRVRGAREDWVVGKWGGGRLVLGSRTRVGSFILCAQGRRGRNAGVSTKGVYREREVGICWDDRRDGCWSGSLHLYGLGIQLHRCCGKSIKYN